MILLDCIAPITVCSVYVYCTLSVGRVPGRCCLCLSAVVLPRTLPDGGCRFSPNSRFELIEPFPIRPDWQRSLLDSIDGAVAPMVSEQHENRNESFLSIDRAFSFFHVCDVTRETESNSYSE